MNETKQVLIELILKEARESGLNSFYAMDRPGEPMWAEPLVGFASGGDELFRVWKKDIGGFYWSPAEAFRQKYNDDHIKDEDLTIISMVFPQTSATKADQSLAEGVPSLRWAITRGEWERYIQSICQVLEQKMENNGIRAVAIDLLPVLSRHTSEKFGIASSWSHRHTAYVAGLGTFGLSDGLITEKGKAVRFSSIIIDKKVDANQRPYKKYNEWCLFYAQGTCGKCIDRCPVGAISQNGHDKNRCSDYLDYLKNNVPNEIRTEDRSHYYGCGLCQSRIPCQDGIPTKIAKL